MSEPRCNHCGAPHPHAHRLYCSDKCKRAARNQRYYGRTKLAVIATAAADRFCRRCDKPLLPKPGERQGWYDQRKYCDRDCKNNALPAAGGRACEQCRASLVPLPGQTQAKYEKRRFCSISCQVRHWKAEHGRPAVTSPVPSAPRPRVQVAFVEPVDERAAIARFIAEKGVTRCPPAFVAPSPQGAISESAAKPLVEAFQVKANPSVGSVVTYLRQQGRDAWSNGTQFKFQGERCSRTDLFRAANKLRERAGLPLYPLPNALAMRA